MSPSAWTTLDLNPFDTAELTARERRLAETEGPPKRKRPKREPMPREHGADGRWKRDRR